jgi:hypothetical protein
MHSAHNSLFVSVLLRPHALALVHHIMLELDIQWKQYAVIELQDESQIHTCENLF